MAIYTGGLFHDESAQERAERRINRAIEPEVIKAHKAKAELETMRLEGEKAHQKVERLQDYSAALTEVGLSLKELPMEMKLQLLDDPESISLADIYKKICEQQETKDESKA